MLRYVIACAFALALMGCREATLTGTVDGGSDGGVESGGEPFGGDRWDEEEEYEEPEWVRRPEPVEPMEPDFPECDTYEECEEEPADSRFVVTVLDENDQPLLGATVFVRVREFRKTMQHNPDSNVFTVFAPVGRKYEVTVYRQGYRAETKMLAFDDDDAVDVAFPMKLSPWKEPVEPEPEPEACKLPDLKGSTAYVLAGYRPNEQGDVVINVDEKGDESDDEGPIVLVLSSYEAARWHVSFAEGARPAHVILYGNAPHEIQVSDGKPLPTTHCKLDAAWDGQRLKDFVDRFAGQTGARIGSSEFSYLLPKWTHLRQ